MKKMLVLLMVIAVASALSAAPVNVRWYVGLGSGGDPPTVEKENKFVAEYNASQKEINLILEVVPNAQAYNTLATEISGGNAPDIVGPVGIRGRDSFNGAWADLEPLVKKNKFDLSQFDKAMVDFYRTKGQGLVGLPYAVYPSFVYVNKALFKEAGIPLPPQQYGKPYVDAAGKSRPWDVNALREIAMKLTVDKEGNDATSKAFDADNIVQFGYGQQYADFRGEATLFGSGSLVGADGKTAQLPAVWAKELQWKYDGMWKDHFIPTKPYNDSDLLNKGDMFASGKIAMVSCHTWYAGFAAIQSLDWDLAATPAYNGKVTSKLHADTFEIMKSSKVQDAAFKAAAAIMASTELMQAYGGMPAKKSAQPAFLAEFSKTKFPGKDLKWQVAIDSLAFNDNPNHESFMPAFQETTTVYQAFFDKMNSTPGLDLAKEEAQLVKDVQKVFVAANYK